MRISGLGANTLSSTDLYNLAVSVGFPPDVAVQMAAIALRESGGNPSAYNGTPPDDSYGLWQINMYGNLGLARMAQFGLSDKMQLFDPVTNATAAYQIWGGNPNNLNIAWSINNGGSNQSKYQANLPVVQASLDNSGGNGGQEGPTIDPGSSVASLDPSEGVSLGALALAAGVVGVLLLSR